MGVLAQKLVLKMRAKFGEAAADVKGQEIITSEVMALMAKAGSVRVRKHLPDMCNVRAISPTISILSQIPLAGRGHQRVRRQDSIAANRRNSTVSTSLPRTERPAPLA